MSNVQDRPIQRDPTRSLVPVPVDALRPEAVCHLPEQGAPPLFIDKAEGIDLTTDAFISWVEAKRRVLDALILAHGGIVLRGFPTRTAEQFNALVGLFPGFQNGYAAGMSPRNKVTGNVLESTRMVEDFKIILHSEMAYMKNYPPRIAFFCRQAATERGATTIGPAREVLKRLPARLRERLEAHKIHVVRNYAPKGNSRDAAIVADAGQVGWDSAFFTEDRAEVEKICRKLGIEPTWNDDGSLTLVDVNEPFTVHPVTGERFYRNNLHTNRTAGGDWGTESCASAGERRPSGHFLDDGEPLIPQDAALIRNILEDIELAWQWRDGDLMILDNLQVFHGRETFSGPREVMVALLG